MKQAPKEYDIELLKKNTLKWKSGRKESNEDPAIIDNVFNFLIDNSLFTQELNEKLDELFEYGEYNGKEAFVLNRLLSSSSNSFNFIFEIDENSYHPYNFNKTFEEGILPILYLNDIKDISFSFEQKILGDPSWNEFEYILQFEVNSIKISKKTSWGEDYLNDFFIALNTTLEKTEYNKKFYDTEMDSRILLDQSVVEKLKKYEISLR